MGTGAILAKQNIRNEEASICLEPLYNMVQATQQSLYDGYTTHNEVYVVRLLSIEFDYNMSQNYFNKVV